MPTPRRTLPALALALLAAVPAAARAGELHLTPYVWIPSIDGTIGQGGGNTDTGDLITLDFSNDIKIGGAMVNVSWRDGRFVTFGDWTYANVTGKSPMPSGWAYSNVEVQIRGNVAQFFTGYEFLDRKDLRLAGFTGARLYDLYGRLTLEAGPPPDGWSGQELDGTRTWVDAVGGVRFEWDISHHWWLVATGDAGTGGSNLSWQAYGMGGYEFGWGSLILGWRHLSIDKGEDRTRLKLTMSGPIIGADFAF
jgi:hypothetical protein